MKNRPMRILLAHNTYRHEGGEEHAVRQLQATLQARGHQVERFEKNSGDWNRLPAFRKTRAALDIPYSFSSRREIRTRMESFKPDILHAHNLFPFLTPSIYDAARERGVRIVQTLHNYRFFCMNGLLFRAGAPCELCVTGGSWHGMAHACYQKSRAKSAVMAATLKMHRMAGTWTKKVDAYIALSQFSRDKYKQAGFPGEKIVVVPNSVNVGSGPGPSKPSGFLYMGRLSREKGIILLLEAFRFFSEKHGGVPLNIAGDGPMEGDVKRFIQSHPHLPIRLLGYMSSPEKEKRLDEAHALLFPSECYENGPFGVLEALARGIPVIGSKRGAVPELIEHQKNGWLFEAGSAVDLAGQMSEAVEQSDGERRTMREQAWSDAKKRFSAERWIEKIEDLYASL